MEAERSDRPDNSMTLITEMMERPLDPGYAAAAERRQGAGLPPATGHRSPLLIIVAIVIGALLGASALALRAPAAATSTVKQQLVSRIEAARSSADAQTRLITGLREQINTAQAAALSEQSQTGLSAELARLELAAGTVPVTGPGLVLTVDDAESKAGPVAPDVNPPDATEPDQGKVVAKDLQILVNGLWDAGAEAISINGHRLTSRSAIRSAGAAILVDYRPLTLPYVITAIGDRGNLEVEFADNGGGSYRQWLTNNFKIRSDIKTVKSVTIPGEPALSVLNARPLQSAVTKTAAPSQRPTNANTAPQRTTPQPTESSP